MNTQGLERFKGLYGKMSGSVWILEITVLGEGESCYQMAFVVSSDGLAITYPSWNKDADIQIKARKVGQEGFGFTVTVVNEEKREWGLILLRMERIDVEKSLEGVFQPATWGKGRLLAGEEIIMIGNQASMPESFFAGRVAYDCKELEFDDESLARNGKCKDYVLPNEKKDFISSRFMGLVFNKKYFDDSKNSSSSLALPNEEFLCKLPIIQCYSLFSLDESAGAPIFSFDGELVGMYFIGDRNFQFGIHVSVIKKFVDSHVQPPPQVDAADQSKAQVS